MAGTWTTALSHRADSENFINGSQNGTYAGEIKIDQVMVTTGDTLTGVTALTYTLIQSIFFTADQDCTIVITLGTGSKSIFLKANQFFYWDNVGNNSNNGNNITNPFGFNLVSAVVNFGGTAPHVIGRIAHA